jgi:hypothetical protein
VTGFIFSLPYTWSYILNFFSIFNPNNPKLNFDSWNIIIALFVGIASVTFLRQQNKIAQIALEQNRPIITISKGAQSEQPKIKLKNQSDQDALIVGIFFKATNWKMRKIKELKSFVLSKSEDEYEIELPSNNFNQPLFISVLLFYTYKLK